MFAVQKTATAYLPFTFLGEVGPNDQVGVYTGTNGKISGSMYIKRLWSSGHGSVK